MFWLGIDVGTGGSRALLVDDQGSVKASYTASHEEMRMELPLWAEQRPENWWDAAVDAIRPFAERDLADAHHVPHVDHDFRVLQQKRE